MKNTLNIVFRELWFDVEKRHKTIAASGVWRFPQLWFDVEKRHKTMRKALFCVLTALWFDVEKRHKTMKYVPVQQQHSCGLM